MSIKMLLLVLSGIFLVLLSKVDCFDRPYGHLDVQCASNDHLCDPNMTNPCCDSGYKCERNWPDNIFRCVDDLIWGLGKYCDLDEDCAKIIHSKCSKDHKCVCRMNNVKINQWTCAPTLNAFCWKNETCATDNAICIGNKCQCTADYYPRYKDQCIRKILGMPCKDDEICSQVKFASCSEDKICTCGLNTTAVNPTYCAPIVGGFCWHDYDCVMLFTKCINNKCECIKILKYDPELGCIPGPSNPNLFGNATVITNSICSEANVCMCFREKSDKFEVCTPQDRFRCMIDDDCSVKNSICIKSYCQCKPRFMYRSNRCVPQYTHEACVFDDDCSQVRYAVCSLDKECVCGEKYIEVSQTSCRPILGGFCTKNEDCAAINSICIKKRCRCKPNLVKFSNNLCTIPQLGMMCKKDSDCQELLNSRCSENKRCNCIPNYEEYNITACAPLLGIDCSKDKLCATAHSSCISDLCLCDDDSLRNSFNQCMPHYIGMECVQHYNCRLLSNSKCINNICACESNYLPLNATVCAPILGESCRRGQQCATPNSLCIHNKCACQPDYVQTYKNRCVIPAEFLFKPCQTDYDCHDIKFSNCTFDKICKCKPNYIALSHKKCIGLIGEYCDSDDECISYDTVCVNNRCQCYGKNYAISRHQCDRISLGLTCRITKDCSVAIENSECSKDGRCICAQNYYALNEFECAPLLFGKCSTNDDCRFNFSVCIGNKCVCEQNYRAVSNNQCHPIDYMYTCDDVLDCGDPWHYQCSPDKRCGCSLNNYSTDRFNCVPLLKGYCWKDSQCLTENSACIDYHCQCKSDFVSVANNLCRPVANMTRVF